MNLFKRGIIFLILFFSLFSNNSLLCQEYPKNSESIYKEYNAIQTIYGLDQVLVNGEYFEDIYRFDLGHPFFQTDEFQEGYMIIHNKKYTNLLLKYNVYDQNIVVLNTDNENLELPFLPPLNYISKFSIKDYTFSKYSFPNRADRFYQEIYLGQISCLAFWEKKRIDSHHNTNFLAYKYPEAKRKLFIVQRDSLQKFNSNKGFIKLFPKEYRHDISNYLKERDIKIYKATDHEIVQLLKFCEAITDEKQLPSTAAADSINNQVSEIHKPKPSLESNFINASFEDFVSSVEESTDYVFFFKPEWVQNISVNTANSDLDIKTTLSKTFSTSNIQFHIADNNIILYQGKRIPAKLPEYQTAVAPTQTLQTKSEPKLTSAEKKYQEGKKVTESELISVGNKQNSQSYKTSFISGKITDQATGEPLIGATIFVQELKTGAATDLDGHFNLALKPGKYLVYANCLSMKEKKFYLQVYSDGRISIPLEKELVSINEVTVIANKIDNVQGMQMGFERLSTKTIKEIPAVMGEKDLLKVAQMLPGVQSAGEGTAGLNVRGGTADQNLFYINKIPIYNTSHLLGFFSAFSPDIVSDFSLYKSNIPAKFGGRVSSVFDISTRQGNKKEFFAQGGISPITGHVAIEGPVVKDKSSFVLSYRATYSDWLLSRVNDFNVQNSQASFYDFGAVFNTEINDKNILKFFGYRSVDEFSLSTTDDYDYANTGGSVSWKHFFSSSLNVDVSAVISQYGFGHNSKSNPSEAYRQEYALNHNELKADFVLLTKKNHRISFGASGILYNLDRGDILPYDTLSKRIPIDLGKEEGFEGAIYISDEFSLLPRLTALAGLRYSFYALLGPQEVNEYFPNSPIDENNIKEVSSFGNGEFVKTYSAPEPRIALNYRVGENNSIKASYNRIQQYIFMLSNTVAISPTDQWKLSDYHIKPPVTDQISLGYYHDFPKKGIVTSAEIYKKWTKNIVEYKDGVDFISSDPTEMLLLQGEQDSYGIEFMVKKNAGKFTGWISYTYSSSTIQVKNDLPTEQINYGKPYPSNFDRPHSINFVSNYKSSRRISFSTVLVYSTGRPITYPIASYYTKGQEVLHYSERNQYRIPDYFRVDVSLNFEGNLLYKKWLHSYWMLNVYNLTGRKNAYSVYYEAKEGKMQAYKLSVFGQPIVTLSWNFKFGNYVSE